MRHKSNAWRIADTFLELRKERRAELAKFIEKELSYVEEKTVHTFTPPYPGYVPVGWKPGDQE